MGVARKKSAFSLHIMSSFYRFNDFTGTWFSRKRGKLKLALPCKNAQYFPISGAASSSGNPQQSV